MFEGKEVKDVFNFKEIYLTNESFATNPNANNGESTLKSLLEMDIAIGFREDNFNAVAYKINTKVIQKIKEDDDCDEIDKNTTSKLDVEYLSIFEISEENYAIEFRELLNNVTEESKEKIHKISDSIIDSVYPYIKDHIEYVYKKAGISIKIPLKL